jgi:hypothetical protein
MHFDSVVKGEDCSKTVEYSEGLYIHCLSYMPCKGS